MAQILVALLLLSFSVSLSHQSLQLNQAHSKALLEKQALEHCLYSLFEQLQIHELYSQHDFSSLCNLIKQNSYACPEHFVKNLSKDENDYFLTVKALAFSSELKWPVN